MYNPPTNLDREIYLTKKLQEICQLQGAKIKSFLYDIKDTTWYITDIPDISKSTILKLLVICILHPESNT